METQIICDKFGRESLQDKISTEACAEESKYGLIEFKWF